MNRKDELERGLKEIEEADRKEQKFIDTGFWILATMLSIYIIIECFKIFT